jgi:hypothetical protein
MVNRKTGEIRWVWVYALLIMGITTIPYLIGYHQQGDQYQFSGFVFAVEDGNSYIAKMLSGEAGAWLFSTPYSTFPQSGLLIYLPYTILGKLASPPAVHEQLTVLFHLFRIVAGVLVIFATYDFISQFVERVIYRRLGLILITIGGGLGWVLILLGRDNLFGSLPLEFYSPESFGFLALYGLPHLALARALFLWGLVFLIKDSNLDKPGGIKPPAQSGELNVRSIFRDQLPDAIRPGFLIGLLWLGAGIAQPIMVGLAWLLIAAYLVVRAIHLYIFKGSLHSDSWSGWARSVIISGVAVIISSPIILYIGYAALTNPFFALWAGQNIIRSPHPIHYLLAYILVLPLAILGIWAGLKINSRTSWLVVVWFLLFPILAYAPSDIQRRFPEGLWVATGTLAMLGIEELARRTSRKQSWVYVPVILALPSTVLLLVGGILATLNIRQPIYLPSDQITAFENLAEISTAGDVVLAAYETGNALPAWIPLRVVIGHGPESVYLEEMKSKVESFYSIEGSDRGRREIIDDLKIRFVFWGPTERALGGWNPETSALLTQVDHVGDYEVFQVRPLE